MKNDNNIFVQIASYRDPELFPTLKNLIESADVPENLQIVVCWQHGDEQSLEDFLEQKFDVMGYQNIEHYNPDDTLTNFDIINCNYKNAQIYLIDVHYSETWGACWARNLIQTRYNNEKYTLQLDSHHRFIESWDTKVIKMLESVRTNKTPKPVLTGYLPSYQSDNDPEGRIMTPWQTNFDKFIPEGAVFFIPSKMESWQQRKTPMGGRFYSGHFAFADGHFAAKVKHDPHYFFHGEEISIAVRAFTHGYDLYMPHRIIAWHEYTREGRDKIWGDATPENKNKNKMKINWVERNKLCHKRNRTLFGMDGQNPSEIDFGEYGFGNVRTLREYEEYAGISFEYRGVQQPTLDKKEPPVNLPYSSEKEWKETFSRSNSIRICAHKNEFPKALKSINDIDFCVIAVHDKKGEEIYRKDLNGKQFRQYIDSDNGFIDYNLNFLSTHIPKSYTMWPHAEVNKWLDKIVKEI